MQALQRDWVNHETLAILFSGISVRTIPFSSENKRPSSPDDKTVRIGIVNVLPANFEEMKGRRIDLLKFLVGLRKKKWPCCKSSYAGVFGHFLSY